MKAEFNCRICGLLQPEVTWDDTGSPSHDICDCCGVEFGYEDYSLDSAREYRNKWLIGNIFWNEPDMRPPEWNLYEQLKDIPDRFK